jgi:hypothetical protein
MVGVPDVVVGVPGADLNVGLVAVVGVDEHSCDGARVAGDAGSDAERCMKNGRGTCVDLGGALETGSSGTGDE